MVVGFLSRASDWGRQRTRCWLLVAAVVLLTAAALLVDRLQQPTMIGSRGLVRGRMHDCGGRCPTGRRAPLRRRRTVAAGRHRADRARATLRTRRDPTHTRRNDLPVAVVAGAVLRRRLPNDFGEPRAERAERRAPDGDAGVGDRTPLAQESHGALDASRHQVGVGSLPIRPTELAREVRGRHQRGACHRRDVERLRVVAVDEVACPAQVHEVGDLLRRHTDDGRRPAASAVEIANAKDARRFRPTCGCAHPEVWLGATVALLADRPAAQDHQLA